MWTYQEQMIMQHGHTLMDPGHTHTDNGHDHEYQDQFHIYTDWHSYLGDFWPINNWKWSESHRTSKGYANLAAAKTSINVEGVAGVPAGALIGDEVRPKNMIVQWIIRIE